MTRIGDWDVRMSETGGLSLCALSSESDALSRLTMTTRRFDYFFTALGHFRLCFCVPFSPTHVTLRASRVFSGTPNARSRGRARRPTPAPAPRPRMRPRRRVAHLGHSSVDIHSVRQRRGSRPRSRVSRPPVAVQHAPCRARPACNEPNVPWRRVRTTRGPDHA